jgi:hypothetical protein
MHNEPLLTVPEVLAKKEEWKAQGDWVPACNGTETPFLSRSGRRLLYCWQPRSGRHAYLDLSTDMILTDEEAEAAMGLLGLPPEKAICK